MAAIDKKDRKEKWAHLPEHFFYDYGPVTPRVLEMLEKGSTKNIAKMYLLEWYDRNFTEERHTISYQDAREILIRIEDSPKEKEFRKWQNIHFCLQAFQNIWAQDARKYERHIDNLRNQITMMEMLETFNLIYIHSDRNTFGSSLFNILIDATAKLAGCNSHYLVKEISTINIKDGWENIRTYFRTKFIPTAQTFYAGAAALRIWAKSKRAMDFIPLNSRKDLKLRDTNYMDLIITPEIRAYKAVRNGLFSPIMYDDIKEEILSLTEEQKNGDGVEYLRFKHYLDEYYKDGIEEMKILGK